MKFILKNIQLLVIILLIIILIMRGCGSNKIEEIVTTKIETKYDTVNTPILQYIPKWKTKTEINIDTLEIFVSNKVDTSEILKDYFSKYYYSDTLHFDTVGYVVINDTISKNSILSRVAYPNIIIPHTTITQTKTANKLEFYAGVGAAASIKPFNLNYAGAEFLLKTKKKQAYGIGVGIDQQLRPILSGRVYWKIGK